MMKKTLIGVMLLLILSIGTIAEATTRGSVRPGPGWGSPHHRTFSRGDYHHRTAGWGDYHHRMAAKGWHHPGRFFVSTGFPFWGDYWGFNLFFSNRRNNHIFFSVPLTSGWGYDHRYNPNYGYYYPKNYMYAERTVVNVPEPYDYGYYRPPNYAYGGSAPVNIPVPVENPYVKIPYTPDAGMKSQDMIFYGGIPVHPAGRLKIATTNKGISGQSGTAHIDIDGLPAGKTEIGKSPFEMGLLTGKHKVTLRKDGKEVFSKEIDIERNKEISLNIDI